MFECVYGSMESARELLASALKSVKHGKQLKVISLFARLEFKHGSQERGRTIFEGIVSNYPKRADLWGMFTDMEMSCADGYSARVGALIERAVAVPGMQLKRVKSLFKKYMKYEKEHGTPERVANVRKLARVCSQTDRPLDVH